MLLLIRISNQIRSLIKVSLMRPLVPIIVSIPKNMKKMIRFQYSVAKEFWRPLDSPSF